MHPARARTPQASWLAVEHDSRKAHDDLESRVRERTAELTKINGQLQAYISEREHLEKKLHRSEERFRLLVEGVTEYAIYMLDPDGMVESWNAGATRIKGYEAKEIIGKHFSCFYTEEGLGGLPTRPGPENAAEKGHIELQAWRQRKDGSRFWAIVVISTLYDSAGAIRGYAKITKDITENRKVEEEKGRLRSVVDAQRVLFQAVVDTRRLESLSMMERLFELSGQTRFTRTGSARRIATATLSGGTSGKSFQAPRILASWKNFGESLRLVSHTSSRSRNWWDLAKELDTRDGPFCP